MTRARSYIDDALRSLTAALNSVHADLDDKVRHNMLTCYEELRAAQQILDGEANRAEVTRAAERDTYRLYPRMLRVVAR